MEDVYKHICPTCGGQLAVDIERQMYVCPFCGGTFDYDYFREESVLDIAAQALSNNEFTSADRAYDFMLDKEPDNFEALRGKALIAMGIPKIEYISHFDLYPKINYESAYKEIDRAIGSSKPQDREYFTVMKDIVDAGNEYVSDRSLLETERNERSKSLNDLYDFVKERDIVFIYSSSRIRPKKAVILTIFCYIFLCLMVFLGYKMITRNPYSKAVDLSQYETNQTFSDYLDYQRALEREEQRKIKYDIWENNHNYSNRNLISALIVATVIYALIVFMLYMGGRYLDSEISKIQAIADEQTDKIKNFEDRITELKGRIKQGYKRLIELHPIDE